MQWVGGSLCWPNIYPGSAKLYISTSIVFLSIVERSESERSEGSGAAAGLGEEQLRDEQVRAARLPFLLSRPLLIKAGHT